MPQPHRLDLADLGAPEIAGLRFWLAGVRLQALLRKANFNPGQLRDEVGRWTDGGGGNVQLVADDLPPLRRMHPDSTYKRDQIAKGALEYWRNSPPTRSLRASRRGAMSP